MAVINGEGLILGRMASHVAKRLLDGENVIIVNAEKVMISGTLRQIRDRYAYKRSLGGPRGKGPYFPRMPDQIVKRTVRGMVPFKKSRGKDAYKNLKVYIGVPKEFQKEKMETIEMDSTNYRKVLTPVGALSKSLGAKFMGDAQ